MKWEPRTPTFGDIVRTKYSFYHHYGIFVDTETVIQFGLPDGPSRPAEEIRVLKSDVYTFLSGGEIEVGIPEPSEMRRMRSPTDIVKEAQKQLGEGGYNIIHNNCEHFVNRCAFGEDHSSFVESIRKTIRNKLNKR